MKVAYITPSLSRDWDIEVVPIEKETWEEVTAQLEAILDNHFMEHGWSGEVTITVKLETITRDRLTELLQESEP